MKKSFYSMAGITLATTMLLTSCIGSFNLSNKVLAWNKTIDSKFINEVVFLAMWIVPVYEICILADAVVFNSIEFWTGDNPVEAGLVKEVKGDQGNYTVETLENGYNIKNDKNDEIDLLFSKEDKTWSVESNGESHPLVKIEEDNQAIVYLPNGGQQVVDLSTSGVLALKEMITSTSFMALK